MKTPGNRIVSKRALTSLLALAAGLWPAVAQIPWATEEFDRRGKVEVYGLGQYLHSDDITFEGPVGDVKMKMNDTGLGGVGIGFHFSDYFSLRGDFMFGNATFSGDVPAATGGLVNITHDAFIQTGRLNLDYNIINRRLTPFLTAGIGYQYLETDMGDLPPPGGAYWDPWFGWDYYGNPPHAWQTDFTWNVGGGVRWNITDIWFVKAMVGANWLQYEHSRGITTQLEAIFSVGACF